MEPSDWQSLGLAYFPPIDWFAKAVRIGYAFVNPLSLHSKNSHWNRLIMAGAEGPVRLSIPLQQGRGNRNPFKEIEIANQYRWQDQHWKSINTCYNKSPWFEFYKDSLDELYSTQHENLLEWNKNCLDWVMKRLGMDFKLLEDNEIGASLHQEVEFLEFQKSLVNHIRYRQVFEERTGFIENLSILDLLFCEGKRSLQILQYNKY